MSREVFNWRKDGEVYSYYLPENIHPYIDVWAAYATNRARWKTERDSERMSIPAVVCRLRAIYHDRDFPSPKVLKDMPVIDMLHYVSPRIKFRRNRKDWRIGKGMWNWQVSAGGWRWTDA